MQVVEHHIQQQILKSLSTGGQRFSELKPFGLENNIFMYHLKLLLKMGLVEKQAAGYQLTPSGIAYVEKVSHKNFKPRLQPKITAILLIKNARGEYAMLRRHTAPYIGHVMFPSGKLHYGERLAEHAQRELREKTGLDTPLQARGLVNLRFVHHDTTTHHILATLWQGEVTDASLDCADARFTTEWVIPNASRSDLLPGTLDILQRASAAEPHHELMVPGEPS